uniref:Uncharacterized protein n=1 Tax=Syphacia muris TaxID=451379 RepID=A0A0N5AZC7_9BILA
MDAPCFTIDGANPDKGRFLKTKIMLQKLPRSQNEANTSMLNYRKPLESGVGYEATTNRKNVTEQHLLSRTSSDEE